jgi:hypothetical protein
MRVLAMAMGAAGVLPGCVAWEIRDEMRAANARLVEVQGTIVQTNERLDRVEAGLTRLDQTNTLIGTVEQGLGRIDSTNSSLSTLEQQLALLNSINTSLSRLDTHLAALRRTIGRIDSAIPFLDLGGGAPVETPPPLAQAGGAGEGAEPAAPGQAEGVAARRDPLLGVWVPVPEDGNDVYVLEADGSFVHAVRGQGTWRREGTRVEFAVAETTTPQPDGTMGVRAAQAWAWEVVHVTARSVAVRQRDVLRVYTRP